jgi:integrase
MKVSFYPRANTIYCRVHHKQDMIRLSTGVKFPEHLKFLTSREEFQGATREVVELNAELSRHRTLLNELYAKYEDLDRVKKEYSSPKVTIDEDKDTYVLAELLQRYIDLATEGKIRSQRNKTILRESTIRVYQFAVNTYLRFSKRHGQILLNEYDVMGKELKAKREIAERYGEHFDQFLKWMIDQDMQINTRSDVITIISVIICYWSDALFIQLPKIERQPSYETPIITLPEDFVRNFITKSGYEKMDNNTKFMWEVCATMFVTSLRVSDAISLKASDFQWVDGEMYMMRENTKTGEFTTLPLPPALAEKYTFNLHKYGSVYTPIDGVALYYFRRKFKSFFQRYPEMHEMISYKRLDARGNKVTVTQKFFELVHPHMLRKTAITSMIKNGVSEDHVRFASGHKSDAIKRYIGWVDRTHKSEVKGYYKTMYNA